MGQRSSPRRRRPSAAPVRPGAVACEVPPWLSGLRPPRPRERPSRPRACRGATTALSGWARPLHWAKGMDATSNPTPASYAEVILPLRPALMGAARALTRSEADASDLVQDTLERTLRTFGRFVPGTDARAWSVTILTRL